MLKTTLNLDTIITLHQVLSRQDTGRIQQFRSRGVDIHEWNSGPLRKLFADQCMSQEANKPHVSLAHSMSCVICCWNILHKHKGSSSAFQWNSGVWNRTKSAGSGQWHPCYMEGAGKDGEHGYRSWVKDLHSELPASHQSDRARGLKEATCGHLIHR